MKITVCAAFILRLLMMPVSASGVGFSRIVTNDPMGGEMHVSLWYPATQVSGTVHVGSFTFRATRDAEPVKGRRGLVVISHGTAGSDLGHRNIAIALADAGFIVAAPLHPRDNYKDSSGVGHRTVMEGRPRPNYRHSRCTPVDSKVARAHRCQAHRCFWLFTWWLHGVGYPGGKT